MSDTRSRKTQLRSDLRRRRKNLSSAQQLAAAQALTRSIGELPIWASAERIALYLAADGEIDTLPLEKMARNLDKLLFLPVICADNSLGFARWDAGDTLSNNRYDIPEPPGTAARCPASNLDIIFLPLVGWDLRGGRLGMGQGFYDRTLAGISGPVLVGLAHDSQQVEDVPKESWDIAMDFIATDAALYRRQEN
ncbi:MAG TPA: 5-formyltetrahydrofolate cyclo-ligase [Halioglobus sp.]